MVSIDEIITNMKTEVESNKRYAKEFEEYANRKIDKLMKLDKIHRRDAQSCIERAEEYEQLIEWLEELKTLRTLVNKQSN